MERRLSYMLLGSFVLILFVSLVAFLFWLTKYGNNAVEYDYYKTYFKESVSGLSVESLVKLRGVEVGRVKKISIDKNDPQKVEVLLQITKGTPIKKDTYATLDTQGITGLKYIELKGGSKNAPYLKTSKNNPAIIPSQKSVISTIFDNSESITTKIEKVLDRISYVLSEKNIKNLQNITANLSNTSSYIDDNKKEILRSVEQIGYIRGDVKIALEQMTKQIQIFNKNLNRFLEYTKNVEDKLLPSFKKLGIMSDKAAIASDETAKFFKELQKKAKDGQFDLSNIVEENIQILNETAISIKELSLKMKELTDALEKSPSDILYKSRKPLLGPGEKK